MSVGSMLQQICAAVSLLCIVGAAMMYGFGQVSDSSGAKGNAGIIAFASAALAFGVAAALSGNVTI